MRALVVTSPYHAEIQEVAEPKALAGEVIVDVQRAGICGTDFEFFTGDMAYLHTGEAEFPIRLGHEWMGTVSSVGPDVDIDWVGKRVTGDTMLGCGSCERCVRGHQHVCEDRFEVGIRHGKAGALADRIAVPASSLHALPNSIDDTAGALVEPGGNALRSVQAAHLKSGDRCLIIGSGTIGLLCAMFARSAGAKVHVLGRSDRSINVAREFGFTDSWNLDTLPNLSWDAVIDASNSAESPERAVELVEPGGHVVFVGLAGTPSTLDTRRIALKDITVSGILSASPGLADTVKAYASGQIDPRGLVATTVPAEELPQLLAGQRPANAGIGPKFHIKWGENTK